MNEPIVSVKRIQQEANLAFTRREPSTACPYPQGSAARELWLQEYAQLHNQYYAIETVAA